MSNIIKSVTSAFAANTRDARIDYHIVEKGSASLITGVYDQTDPIVDGFYRKPDITGTGNSTKLAVIYGQAMISPYLIDAGVESSTNDPGSILKTYRFITGDGTNSGIVSGPNGSPLENIYIKDPNGVQTPVVDSNGRSSLGNVILASALGAAITSAPKIWDAIKGAAPSTSKTSTVDPVTGKPIPSNDAKNAKETASSISLGSLSDVSTANNANNKVLAYDTTQGKWVSKDLNSLLSDVLSASTVTGGQGGTGGTGGSGGQGGTGGTGGQGGTGGTGGVVPEVSVCYPTANFISYSCALAPTTTRSGMVLLPTSANTANNEYTQSISAVGTNGLELHFFTGGCGKKATYKISNGDTANCVSSPVGCLTDPAKGTAAKPSVATEITYQVPAEILIQICLTANICGAEYLIYKTTISESALSNTSYTFTAPTIYWSDTKLAPLLAKYPGQIFNSTTPNVKLYLSRTDLCGSEYDLQFEGYKRIIGDSFYRGVLQPAVSATPTPTPVTNKADDGKFPEQKPLGGGMSAPSCPADAPLPSTAGLPGLPGSSGASGTGGSLGSPGALGSTGSITVAPAKASPTISLSNPCSKQYGTQTTPPAFDGVVLPTLTLATSITNQSCTVDYKITDGNGVFSLTGSPTAGVSFTTGDRSLQFTGVAADVATSSSLVKFTPDNASKGEIMYTVIITNSEGTKAGTGCSLVPKNLVVTNSQSATAKVCVDSTASGGTGKVMATFNGKTVDLTAGYVSYTTSPTATAALVASNINGNVAFQNALDPTNAAWLPKFNAVASGTTVTVTAPAAGGSDFNGVTLTTAFTGAFVWGSCNGTFLGGVTQTISDFLKNNVPAWDKVSGILTGIAGNVVGAVALNMIMNKSSQVQISIPSNESVDVTFLYRGRIVSVPNEYDAENRTGHPASYAAFSGTWKQQWTQNPAWCLYDFITNKKYGLGIDLVFTTAQRTALLNDIFAIGKYCDDIVVTSAGVNQPRFSLNTVITEGTKLQILQQICSVFYGAYIFNNGSLRITCDRPDSTIKLLVNQANAGSFDKALTSSKNFVNKVRLSYVEPSNFYTEEIVIAENDAAISQWGERASDVVAFGCTNADQAIRYATWILNSEIENSKNIQYQGGLDHYNLVPGDIVEFYNSNERNKRRAGRIVSQSGTSVVLDAPILSVAGDYFSLTLADGTVHQTTIASISGVNVVLTTVPLSAANPYATFISADAAQGRKLYKVIKIEETSNSKFSVALQYFNPSKFV